MAGVDDDELDRILLALANPHRRDIVRMVGLQPQAINQLAQMRKLSLPAIHKHLKVLEDVGLVSRRKRGRTTYVELLRAPLALLQQWVNQFHPYWGTDGATYDNYAQHLSAAKDPTPPTETR